MKTTSRRVSPAPTIKAGRKAARPALRVLGTEITLLESVRERAQRDLGIDIEFEVLDFVQAQRKAAMEPGSYDIYDQCFHNLDIVWNWHALQPIDTARIGLWDKVSPLTKVGRLSSAAPTGRGDAPIRKLYVQPSHALGEHPSRWIGMLPTVYNMDSFVYSPGPAEPAAAAQASWSWLFDERFKGRVALVDEPAIGALDAALAFESMGLLQAGDIANLTVPEIDQMMALLEVRKRAGFFCGLWRTPADSVELMRFGRAAIQTIWSPAIVALRSDEVPLVEAVPVEGYRAWHGGLALSSRLPEQMHDAAYAYLNWWLSGWPGALMARQGYYFSVPEKVREALTQDEWSYWYAGEPARTDLPGPDGRIAVRAGQVRAGGSYVARASHIALWDTTMDEHNYLVRRWSGFAAAISS